MKNEKNNIRDFLYDEPGPKAKRRIIFWTIVSLVPIAFLLYRMTVRFQENGQLAPQYWSFSRCHCICHRLSPDERPYQPLRHSPEDFSCTD